MATLATGAWVHRHAAADCPLDPSVALASTPGEQKAMATTGDGSVAVIHRQALTSTTSHLLATIGSAMGSCSGGAAWGSPLQLDDEATRDKKLPVAATGPDGTVYVVWELWVDGVLGRVGFTSSGGPASAVATPAVSSLLLDN